MSYNWGGGQPEGKVKDIKEEGELKIQSKGKQVKKNATPENPAVHLARDGNDVVKHASELNEADIKPGQK